MKIEFVRTAQVYSKGMHQALRESMRQQTALSHQAAERMRQQHRELRRAR